MLSINQYFERRFPKEKIRLSNPAPSKFRFLLSRLLLRKRYKVTFIAAVLLCIFSFLFHFSFLQLRVHESFLKVFSGVKDVVLGRPEFTIKEITVRVDNMVLKEKIIEVVDIQFPVSSLTLNLEDTRRRIEKLSGVKSATVSVDNYGKLIVTAMERQPAVINKVGSKYFLLDKDGFLVNEIMSRLERPDLPLFIGYGIEKEIEDGLKLLLDFGQYTTRVNALTWVGRRRWDIVFDKERVIKLPSSNPRDSLKRLIALDFEFNIFASDILTIDLRSEKFLILRTHSENQGNKRMLNYVGEGT